MIPRVPRTLSIVPLLIALSACSETESSVGDALSGQWVDLTHDFSPETLYWPTSPPFELTVESRGEAEGGYWYEAYSFRSAEHGGTHIDAPVHFAKGRRSVEAIPLDDLVGPACVINVATAAIADADYQVTVADIEAWENQHGALPAGAIVLLRTGYGTFWPDAARWLVDERRLNAIGIDTPSIDFGQSRLFESHRILFERNVPAFENVANLDRLPAAGAWVIALPMKIRGGSGGPLRIVALLPR